MLRSGRLAGDGGASARRTGGRSRGIPYGARATRALFGCGSRPGWNGTPERAVAGVLDRPLQPPRIHLPGLRSARLLEQPGRRAVVRPERDVLRVGAGARLLPGSDGTGGRESLPAPV